MNRYLLFAYGDYYPNGGADDIVGAYACLADAKSALVKICLENWEGLGERGTSWEIDSAHIFDIHSHAIVYEIEKLSGRGDEDPERFMHSTAYRAIGEQESFCHDCKPLFILRESRALFDKVCAGKVPGEMYG